MQYGENPHHRVNGMLLLVIHHVLAIFACAVMHRICSADYFHHAIQTNKQTERERDCKNGWQGCFRNAGTLLRIFKDTQYDP
jgi:hypothetical protein